MPVPDSWTDLIPVLSEDWTLCTAWSVGGGDPDGLDIRVKGGRAQYSNAWCEFRRLDWVRLCRVDSLPEGLCEVVRFVKPDTLVEVRRSKETQ